MPDFTNYNPESSFQPPNFQAIRPQDVSKIKSNYGISSFKPAGQSDSALYKFSTKAILDWWKKTKAADLAASAPVAGAAPAKPAGTAGTTAKPAPKPTTGASTSRPAASGTMSDTAMGSGGPKPINSIAVRKAVNAPTYAKQREGSVAAPRLTALSSAPSPYTYQYHGPLGFGGLRAY